MTSKKTITIKKKTIPIISTITETITTNKEKGDLYEKYIYYNLQNLCTYKNVWLWKNIPEYELLKSQIMDDWNTARLTRKREHIENRLPDFGTDLLALETDINGTDKYSIIQCKKYNDSRTLRAEDLGTFYFMMYRYSKFVNGLVFHTNDLSTNLLNHNLTNDNIKYLKVKFEEGKYDLGNLDDNIDDEENSTVILKPHQYQIDAYNALKGKTRGILQMACGTGKTLVSIMLAKDYKQNIIIAPLKAYCEQNMMRFASQMSSDYKMLIIDSDNDGRNIENIKEFIKTNAKFCLFCTYKSIDIINEIKELKLIDDCYVIIDEFHNICYKDVYGEVEEEDEDFEEDEEIVEEYEDFESDDDSIENKGARGAEALATEALVSDMYKLLHSDARIMFMSATPRLFENDDFNYYEYDEDDKGARGAEALVFGEIDYTYSMSDAIEQKRVADYRIIVPTLSISKYEGIEKIYKECNLKDYDKELVVKTRYIIKGCMELGNRKCIIYLQSQAECKEMTEIINEQCKNYFAIKNYCTYIISSDLKAERAFKLKKFANFEDYSFICSVDILNECIDIPKCDSIFIAYPSKSKIRNIQRLCRANRKDAENVDKIATIFLWAEEYKTDLVDFMVHIKEFDSKFSFSKVKRLNVSSENKSLMMPDVEVKESKDLENIVIGFKVAGNWMEKYNELDKFIEDNKRLPNKKKYDIKEYNISKWCKLQKRNYNFKRGFVYNKFKIEWEILKNKYNDLMTITYDENRIDKWNKMYLESIEFLKTKGYKPSSESKDLNENNLGVWIQVQTQNFKNKKNCLTNNELYDKWQILLETFPKIKIDSNNFWFNMLKFLDNFITENKKLPRIKSNDNFERVLNRWMDCNKKHYKLKQFTMKNKNSKYYKEWTNLKNKHYDLLLSTEEKWYDNYNLLIDKFLSKNIKPLKSKKDNIETKIAGWIRSQFNNIRLNKESMTYPDRRKLWDELIVKYKHLMMTQEEECINNIKRLMKFIDINKKTPNKHCKNNKDELFLGRFLGSIKINIKNKKGTIFNENVKDTFELLKINYKEYIKL